MTTPESLTTLYELAKHELYAKRKETFMGLLWMVLWPFIQSGGFLLAFKLLSNHNPTQQLLTTYLGVLVWSSTAMMFTTSLTFFTRNAETIKTLCFPFHIILLSETTIKLLFFSCQFIVVAAVFAFLHPPAHPILFIFSVFIFMLAFFLICISACWLGSLIGAVVPDATMAIPPILTLLLALSPVFHPDMSTLPKQILLVNQLNPLSHLVQAAYQSVGYTTPATPPIGLASSAVIIFIGTKLAIRRLYQEIAKVI